MMKITLLFLLLLPISLLAQCFDPGDGSDGEFHATVDTTIVGNTYQFTSFTIDAGITVTVSGNNPLIIYCQGTSLINGALSVNGGNGSDGITYTSAGIGGIGTAGGANGGNGSFSSGSGPLDGFDGGNTGGANTKGTGWSGGGGAGYATAGSSSGGVGGFAGITYGDNDITGLTSGSGGGGGSGGYDCGAGGGGAGGGVIVLYTTNLIINASGEITSNGGNGGSDGIGNCGGGGGGSGGSIFIQAANIQNDGLITAAGGIGGASNVSGNPYYGTGGSGSAGRIRIDHSTPITGSGTVNPGIGGDNPLPGPIVTDQEVTICYGEDFTVGSNTHNTSGTYQDILTAASGCDSTVNTVLTILDVIATNQSITLCAGESITIGSNTHNTSGNYQDVLTAASGCDSIINTTLMIENAINVTVTNNISSLQAASSAGTFQWINCATTAPISGETASTFAPSANGSYAVIVTVNNCSDTSACQTISGLGIDDQLLVNGSVYPNPTSGIFQVEFSAEESAEIKITDFSGRAIQTISGYVSGEEINLSKEARGIYLVHVMIGNQVQTVKITKN